MNIVKQLREDIGYTQKVLAEKSGLSLRTIQRLESTEMKPKGHTLTALSSVFQVDPSMFQNHLITKKEAEDADRLSISLINLSSLAFFLIPFGNIIVPMLVWRKRKKSAVVDQAGRKIINFQILWSMSLCFLLCIAPFGNDILLPAYPLILIVLFLALAINLVVIMLTGNLIRQHKLTFLSLPIQVI